jgi:hypothetical protein
MHDEMGYCHGRILLWPDRVGYNEPATSPSKGIASGKVTGIRLLVA